MSGAPPGVGFTKQKGLQLRGFGQEGTLMMLFGRGFWHFGLFFVCEAVVSGMLELSC